jgi:hypothetical protein
LISSIPTYIRRSILTILRIFIIYKPLRFFTLLATLVAIPAMFFIFRFLLLYAMGGGSGHVQSLVLAAGLVAIAGIAGIGGVLAELIATNRLLLEDLRMRALRVEIESAVSTMEKDK